MLFKTRQIRGRYPKGAHNSGTNTHSSNFDSLDLFYHINPSTIPNYSFRRSWRRYFGHMVKSVRQIFFNFNHAKLETTGARIIFSIRIPNLKDLNILRYFRTLFCVTFTFVCNHSMFPSTIVERNALYFELCLPV